MKQPAFVLAMGIIGGVALASWIPLPFSALLAACACWRYPLLALGTALGICRIVTSPLAPSDADLSVLGGKEQTVEGTIVSFPEYRQEYQQFVVQGSAKGKAGKTLVRTDPFSELLPGDRVAVTGFLDPPRDSGDFDYKRYLAKDGIHSITYRAEVTKRGSRRTLQRFFYGVRKAWVRQTERTFSEPSAGFMLGILIGERSTLSDEHIRAFKRTGTTHILALSGFNISVIIAAIVGVLGRKPAALTASLVLIGGFVLLVGPSSSVVRAALMGSFLLIGQLLGRPQMAIYVTIVTAAGMLLVQPHALRYDLGFDLSFLATLGILWLEPDIRKRLTTIPEPAKEVISTTLAAGVSTAPLIVLVFGTVSPVSPLANLLVVPFIPVLMLGGFIAVMLSFISPLVAVLPAFLTSAVTTRLLGGIIWLGDLPGASVSFAGGKVLAAAMVTGLACSVVLWLKSSRYA
jgi:competence protein ComEC